VSTPETRDEWFSPQSGATRFFWLFSGAELPTASLNVQATNRFITHAIPDLTEAQRSGLRAINKRERDKQSGAAPVRFSDEKVANRDIRV
jgi:hypothetical protein